jgi:hypothetical protein
MARDGKLAVAVQQQARTSTLLITNMIKLAGAVGGVNEILIRSELRQSAVALAAFMMAGAQFSESVLLRLIDRVLPGQPGDK